jgi:hypothetical protein
MDDAFGKIPGRPDHPDFWKLSQIVLRTDGRLEADPDAFRSTVSSVIDLESLTYFARQRVMRLFPGQPERSTIALMSLYMDAFIMGAEFDHE